MFWWAKFKKTKSAIKLHTLFDVKSAIPCFIHITEAAVHYVNAMVVLDYEKGSYYVFDRGYIDFKRLYCVHTEGAFFVTRAKDNFDYKRQKSKPRNKSKGVICDQLVLMKGYYAAKNYPDKIRRIKYYDAEIKKTLVFITNNFDLSALEIALLYKYRWRVELFFKWTK